MGGGNDNPQVTETNPWAPAAGAGQQIIDLAGQLFEQQGGINGNWIDFNAPGMNQYLQDAYAQMGQNKELGNISNQLGGIAGQLAGALPGALSSLEKAQEGYTTYDIQNMRDTLLGDKQASMDAQNAAIMANLEKSQAQAVGGIYGAAAGGGNVGSSRTQLASGQATGNLSAQAQATMANIASQSFDTSQAAAMNTLQQQQQANLAAAQAGFGAAQAGASIYGQQAGIQQQMNQNMLQAGLGQFNYDMMQAQIQYQNMMGQQNAGWQNLGMYNQMIAPWAGAGGTSQVTGNSGPSLGQQIFGGALAVGSMFI